MSEATSFPTNKKVVTESSATTFVSLVFLFDQLTDRTPSISLTLRLVAEAVALWSVEVELQLSSMVS